MCERERERDTANLNQLHLGSGHFPLSLSSSTYFSSTSLHRLSSEDTASFVMAAPPLPSPSELCVMKENWSSVSKHDLANSSRSLRLESTSKTEQNKKKIRLIFKLSDKEYRDRRTIEEKAGRAKEREREREREEERERQINNNIKQN